MMHVGDILSRVRGYHAYIRAPWCMWGNEGGDSLIKVGTDLRAPGIRYFRGQFLPGQ